MISLKNISFSYSTPLSKNKVKVFNDFSISFDKNKIYTLTAPNGYGKTTLLKIIAGFLIPENGIMFIQNNAVDFKKFPYEKISLFYNQERAFYHQLTVIENLNFYGFSNIKEIKEKLTCVNFEADNIYKKFAELSSGNKSKAVILKVLLEDKPVILLDEPFSYIDIKSKEIIKNYLNDIKKERCLVISTNNPVETEKISDEIVDIKDVCKN